MMCRGEGSRTEGYLRCHMVKRCVRILHPPPATSTHGCRRQLVCRPCYRHHHPVLYRWIVFACIAYLDVACLGIRQHFRLSRLILRIVVTGKSICLQVVWML